MTRETFLETARRVIGTEAAALGTLATVVDETWASAIELLLEAQGRVVVSGMGKSGHVARKIAATFASTGTPAQFVHPAEASHGDLGMMTRNDVALVLSNSGETPELANLIAYTRRFDIPMIGVASRVDSTLCRNSDVALVLPEVQEACGTGIVPTSSTTMTLALGDALAIALMEHRQFTPAHFREFHPGGKLGAMLARVEDLMHSGNALPLVRESTPMGDALLTMSAKGLGVVGVINDNTHLTGMITDGDLRRHMDGLLEKTAGDVMTPDPLTIDPDALAQEALAVMNQRRITALFTCKGREPVGVIKIHDCLRAGLE